MSAKLNIVSVGLFVQAKLSEPTLASVQLNRAIDDRLRFGGSGNDTHSDDIFVERIGIICLRGSGVNVKLHKQPSGPYSIESWSKFRPRIRSQSVSAKKAGIDSEFSPVHWTSTSAIMAPMRSPTNRTGSYPIIGRVFSSKTFCSAQNWKCSLSESGLSSKAWRRWRSLGLLFAVVSLHTSLVVRYRPRVALS
jgi:hypothetical protein